MRRLGLFAGAAALLTAVFALGGALRWAQAAVAVLAAIMTLSYVGSRSANARTNPLLVFLGLAAAITALQVLPMPRGVLEALQGPGSSFRDDGARLMEISPANTLSLDVPATLGALAFFVILLAVAVMAGRLAVSERGRYRLLAAVAACCLLVAIVVGVHALFGIDELYGVYDPSATPSILGPLLNENHLGGLMAVGANVALGLLVRGRQPSWVRGLWLVTLATCGALTVASHSRGATLAMMLGLLVACGILLAQRLSTSKAPTRGRTRLAARSIPLAVVAACAVVLVIYSSAGGIEHELARTSLGDVEHPTSKFLAWRSAARLVEESPWVGVGRGAMEPAFSHVHPSSGHASFSHLENEYIQAVVDWGVPAALLLGAVAVWVAVLAVQRWRDGAPAAGAIGGMVAAIAQSHVDFGLELLGLAVPVTIVAATLTYRPTKVVSGRSLLRVRIIRAAHAAALVGCAALLLSPVTTTLAEDRAQLDPDESDLGRLRSALERHPLDYYGYALASRAMIRKGDPRGVELLNHALLLHPYHPGLHLMAARLLERGGHPEQAAIEYALAMTTSPAPQSVLREITSTLPLPLAVAAIPPNTAAMKYTVSTLQTLGRTDVAIGWLVRVLERDTRDAQACSLLYGIASEQGGNVEAVSAALVRCTDSLPDPHARLALARQMAGKGAHDEIIRLLSDVETWRGKIDQKVSAWFLLCDAHTARHDWDVAKRCLRRLDASGDVRPERRSEVTSRLELLEKNRIAAEVGSGSAH